MKRLALLVLLSGSAVFAAETIRILPDQAVLACQARTEHALTERGAEDPTPIKRFSPEAMENFMFRVKGLYRTRIEGEEQQVDVECDVSSNGVEVFTMVIEPM
ncbi:MAG: hypothetical protein AAF415_15645 [Pseudomonadota bacterium]